MVTLTTTNATTAEMMVDGEEMPSTKRRTRVVISSSSNDDDDDDSTCASGSGYFWDCSSRGVLLTWSFATKTVNVVATTVEEPSYYRNNGSVVVREGETMNATTTI